MKNTDKTMVDVVALCKNRGFIFPGSDIYGGLSNAFDYAPLGVQLKRNIKDLWWKKFVTRNDLNVGLDSAILMNSKIWEASGHVGGFSDPLMDCKECKSRFRADHLVEDYIAEKGETMVVEALSDEELLDYINSSDIKCPSCGKKNFTDIRKFNLMFKTHQGVTEDSSTEIYLRPETAQGIFVNFKAVQRASRKRVPFGIAQIGKSFRNEITPGNFIFRTREFEQMELEFFCQPGTEIEWFAYWKDFCKNWLLELGLSEENIRIRDHSQEELSHYSNATSDFEYLFPFGWGELWGLASRTDFDLTRHQEHSGVKQEYIDPVTNERYIPYVVEPSVGVERLLLSVLIDAYDVEELENDKRIVLRLHPKLAPYKVAVFPQAKKLSEQAKEVFKMLNDEFEADYDDAGSLGKRYRRHDEIGTPFCVTYDYDSLDDGAVTVRDRDTMLQERVQISELNDYIRKLVNK